MIKYIMLKSNEVCEYNKNCFYIKCNGKNNNWKFEFSCALRVSKLMTLGYEMK